MFRHSIRSAIVAVTVGAVAFTGVAWAQSPAESTAPESATDEPQPRHGRHHRGHRGGGAIAQTAELTGLDPRDIVSQLNDGASIAQVAAANGSSGDEVVAAIVAKISERLADAVTENRITQEQADARLVDAEERLNELVVTENPAQAKREARQAAREERAQAVADLLSLTTDDLKAAREDGQSLTDLAAQQGVPVDDVVDVLAAPLAEKLSEAVGESRITQEQADERLARAEERIANRLENGPRHRPGRNGRRGPAGVGPAGG